VSAERDNFRPCVVIPNFNHGYALAGIIAELERHALTTIVINDASTDDTAQILDDLARSHSWVKAVHRTVNGGKGAAIRDGLQSALGRGFSHALCIDGDGQHSTDDIQRFLEEARRHPATLILGTPRFGPDAPYVRRIGREFSNILVALSTWSLQARDVLCGFRVYPLYPVLENGDLESLESRMGFDVQIVINLVWKGVPVVNVPTPVRYDPAGVSHFRYGRDNVKMVRLFTVAVTKGLWCGPRRLIRSCRTPRPDSKTWYQIRERGSVRGLRLLLRVFEFLGRTPLLAILMPVVLYLFLRGGEARRSALSFQRRVMRLTDTPERLLSVYWRAFRQFWEFGVSIVDKVVSWRSGLPLERFTWKGRDEVKARLAQGQGVVLMGAHVGNLEVIRALGHSRNVVVNALMFTGNSKTFRVFLEEVNRTSFVRVHDLSGMDANLVFQLQESIARGEIVALLADRLPKYSAGRSIPVPFLGQQAQFPEGPWILASMLEAPVYSVFSMRGRDGRYHVEFEEMTERVNLPRDDRSAALANYARRFADKLGSVILRRPDQWFNFYDFWREATPATEEQTSPQAQQNPPHTRVRRGNSHRTQA
jgi:predicted LPLAT superfamily acyltransferase